MGWEQAKRWHVEGGDDELVRGGQLKEIELQVNGH
jgi:hypothetical protein